MRESRRLRKLQGLNLLSGESGDGGLGDVAALWQTNAVCRRIERRMAGDSVAESGLYDTPQAAKLVRT